MQSLQKNLLCQPNSLTCLKLSGTDCPVEQVTLIQCFAPFVYSVSLFSLLYLIIIFFIFTIIIMLLIIIIDGI